MADKPSRTENLPDTLHGMIIRSNIDWGTVLRVTPPKQDKRFFTLGPEDIPGENIVQIYNDQFPLLASKEISYRGQPIIALFGPDTEMVEVKSREVEIDFQLSADSTTEQHVYEHSPIVYEWGEVDSLFGTTDSIFERTYTDRRVWTREDIVTRMTTWLQDDLLYVQGPTQWPFHVRDTVATCCGRTKKSVIVLPEEHFSPKDEKLIHPSILAATAALATLKTNQRVIITSRFPTSRSQVTIRRKTALESQGKPLAEIVEATIDQGAFPLFSGEMVKQLLAGLIPLYELQAFRATIKIVESHQAPSHFFGDLGYSTALFSTEAHASALAERLQLNPANWRIKQYADGKKRSEVIETLPTTKLRDLISTTCSESDFSRHYSVYELQRKTRKSPSTFLNYTRGIGIACGAGISGFSSDSPFHSSAKIAVTLDAKNSVLVNTSFFPSKKTAWLWRSLIAKELSVDQADIAFVQPNTSYMIDTGPEVLSLDVERSVTMIQQCCAAIKSQRFQEPLPITHSITAKSALATSETALFTSRNWGCLVIELEVNTITFSVEARRVWGRFSCNHVANASQLALKFRHIIHHSLWECNVIPMHRTAGPPLMDISVNSLGSDIAPSSATSALRGMVMAACAGALSQALNCETLSLPVTEEDIISWIRRDV